MCAPRRRVLMLLYKCPHTVAYVSSYCYICALILLHMCPHATIHVWLCSMCEVCSRQARQSSHITPATTVCVIILRYMSSYYYMCDLILLYMCPHSAVHVSSYPHATLYTGAHIAYRGRRGNTVTAARVARVDACVPRAHAESYWQCVCVCVCRGALQERGGGSNDARAARVAGLYVSSYYSICVVYMCPHTTICVCSHTCAASCLV